MDKLQNGDSATRKEFVERVTECMRSEVLGSESTGCHSQWSLPLTDGDKRVEPWPMTDTASGKLGDGTHSKHSQRLSFLLTQMRDHSIPSRQDSTIRPWRSTGVNCWTSAFH